MFNVDDATVKELVGIYLVPLYLGRLSPELSWHQGLLRLVERGRQLGLNCARGLETYLKSLPIALLEDSEFCAQLLYLLSSLGTSAEKAYLNDFVLSDHPRFSEVSAALKRIDLGTSAPIVWRRRPGKLEYGPLGKVDQPYGEFWNAKNPDLFKLNDRQLASLMNIDDLNNQLVYWNNNPGLCLMYARLAELHAVRPFTAIRRYFETPVSGAIAGSVKGVEALWRMAVAGGVEITASVMLPEGKRVPLAEHPFRRDREKEVEVASALAEDLAVLDPSTPVQPVERLYAILRLLFDEGPKQEFSELADALVQARSSGTMVALDLREWDAGQVDQHLAEAFAPWDHLGAVSVLAGLTMKLPPGKLEAVLLGKGFSADQAKRFAALGDLLGELEADKVSYVFETSLGSELKVDFDDLQLRLALLAFPEHGELLESIFVLPADRFLPALASRLSQWPVPARSLDKVRTFLSAQLRDGELSLEQVQASLPPAFTEELDEKVQARLLRAVAKLAQASEEERPEALETLAELVSGGGDIASQAELISSALAGLYQADLTRVSPLGEVPT